MTPRTSASGPSLGVNSQRQLLVPQCVKNRIRSLGTQSFIILNIWCLLIVFTSQINFITYFQKSHLVQKAFHYTPYRQHPSLFPMLHPNMLFYPCQWIMLVKVCQCQWWTYHAQIVLLVEQTIMKCCTELPMSFLSSVAFFSSLRQSLTYPFLLMASTEHIFEYS